MNRTVNAIVRRAALVATLLILPFAAQAQAPMGPPPPPGLPPLPASRPFGISPASLPTRAYGVFGPPKVALSVQPSGSPVAVYRPSRPSAVRLMSVIFAVPLVLVTPSSQA